MNESPDTLRNYLTTHALMHSLLQGRMHSLLQGIMHSLLQRRIHNLLQGRLIERLGNEKIKLMI